MAAFQVEGVEGKEHACGESRGPGWGGQVVGGKLLILVVSTCKGHGWIIYPRCCFTAVLCDFMKSVSWGRIQDEEEGRANVLNKWLRLEGWM